MDIHKIDKNFKSVSLDGVDLVYHDILKAPFVLEGFPWCDPAEGYNRLPSDLTEQEVNKGALEIAHCSTGGAARFRTDSPCLAIRFTLAHACVFQHMPRAGVAGFDFYRGCGAAIQYRATAQPSPDNEEREVLLFKGAPSEMNDWTCYLPLYGAPSSIEIGVAPDAKIEPPTARRLSKPILFYGSSITQGGCASRPGNAFASMLCRYVDAPQINLGFSGCGLGESAIADLIGDLELSAFVMDYDHNAPSVEHLQNTHGPFFERIRSKQPELPVVFVSRCDFKDSDTDRARRDVIRETYSKALAKGDRKVWFVDGAFLFGVEDRDACTVDGVHPNDLGFYRMFKGILPTLRQALES